MEKESSSSASLAVVMMGLMALASPQKAEAKKNRPVNMGSIAGLMKLSADKEKRELPAPQAPDSSESAQELTDACQNIFERISAALRQESCDPEMVSLDRKLHDCRDSVSQQRHSQIHKEVQAQAARCLGQQGIALRCAMAIQASSEQQRNERPAKKNRQVQKLCHYAAPTSHKKVRTGHRARRPVQRSR